MTQVWVGVSRTLPFRELIVQYVDPYFQPVAEGEDPVPFLVSEFGADPIGPGDFECYDGASEPLSLERFQQLTPFHAALPGLEALHWDGIRSAFFVVNAAVPKKRSDANLQITDMVDVTFDWQ